ncbi:MAG: hypothetical protein QMD43_09950 [Thermodesulfovibrio sp.]|nr:hypothetical protein [Thermodesulfovibrio sp.]
MEIQFRKDVSIWNWNKEVYEWKPLNSQTWYRIHRNNIVFPTGERNPHGFSFERNVINQALQGKILTLKATTTPIQKP